MGKNKNRKQNGEGNNEHPDGAVSALPLTRYTLRKQEVLYYQNTRHQKTDILYSQ